MAFFSHVTALRATKFDFVLQQLTDLRAIGNKSSLIPSLAKLLLHLLIFLETSGMDCPIKSLVDEKVILSLCYQTELVERVQLNVIFFKVNLLWAKTVTG